MITQKNAFTIDPYSDFSQYNQALATLINNNIKYEESIQSISPFLYFIHTDTNQKPMLIDYENMNDTQWRKLLTKTKALVPNDEFLLYRRTDKISSIFLDVVGNDYMKEVNKSKKVIIFSDLNKGKVQDYSKNIDSKIYMLGKYYSKYRLYLCFSDEIKNFVSPGNILLEMNSPNNVKLELKINYDILKNKEKLIKYTRTPYFKDGKLFQTSPVSPIFKQM